MKTNWTLKVTEELNDRTFEAAHDLEISKSEFIRQAVEEKIGTPEKKPQKIRLKNGSEISVEGNDDNKLEGSHTDGMFHPQPKKGKK